MDSVGARGVVHMLQFNGKQEGKSTPTDLTCAAPATVSRRDPGFRPVPAFTPQPLDNRFRPALREGGGGRSASPDTGQHGGDVS
jgi:hypothetical protein